MPIKKKVPKSGTRVPNKLYINLFLKNPLKTTLKIYLLIAKTPNSSTLLIASCTFIYSGPKYNLWKIYIPLLEPPGKPLTYIPIRTAKALAAIETTR